MGRKLIAAGTALMLAGCGTNSAKIEAIPYSDPSLAAATCETLAPRVAVTEAELLRLVKIQGEERVRDVGEIWAFGLASSVFTQEELKAREAEIARLKGERAALRGEAGAKGCNLPPPHRILQRIDARERG